MLPFTSPCWLRNPSSARLMTSTMALPIPSTSKAAVVMNSPELQGDELQGNQVHARLGLFKQGHDARDGERHIAAQARAINAERTQAHFAHDEARAKLDAGLQQGLEVADAALAVFSVTRPVVEGRRRARQGMD